MCGSGGTTASALVIPRDARSGIGLVRYLVRRSPLPVNLAVAAAAKWLKLGVEVLPVAADAVIAKAAFWGAFRSYLRHPTESLFARVRST